MLPMFLLIMIPDITDHGARNDYIITETTFQLLMDTIEFTEGLRNACNIEALKDYFFLYPGNNAAIYHFNATTLYNKGIPLVYIQKYMGHVFSFAAEKRFYVLFNLTSILFRPSVRVYSVLSARECII